MSGAFINQTFDDTDNSTLTYDGFWFRIGTYNASSTGETGTLASTNVANASVTIRFPTPARAFYVYGIKRSKGGSYGICIDCDPNQPNFLPIDGVDPTDDGTKPPVVLFSQTFDKPGSHVVILRNEVDNRFPNGNSQLAFDRFDLEVANPNPASSAQSSPTRSPAQGSPSPPKSNTGAIVGGVVGGLLGLLLIAVLIFFLWRRQRQQQAPSAPPNGHPESVGSMSHRDDLPRITPYSNGNYVGYSNPSMYQPSSQTTYDSSPIRRKQPSDPISPSSRGYGTTTRSEGTSSMLNGSTSSGSHVRAIDAGPLTATLPPEYGHWTS